MTAFKQFCHKTAVKRNSIYEAYCHVFEVDPDETLKQIDQYLKSSEQEYRSLLKEHLQHIRPQSSLDDSPDSFFLSVHEKERFYQGQAEAMSRRLRKALSAVSGCSGARPARVIGWICIGPPPGLGCIVAGALRKGHDLPEQHWTPATSHSSPTVSPTAASR